MKRITFIRHAKSSWDSQNLTDYDRPLNERGKHDAPMMGGELQKRGHVPDQVFSSSAVRAITTANMIAAKLGCETKLTEVEGLYCAPYSEMIAFLKAVPDEYTHVFLVGHNPGITECVNDLADAAIDNVPTCGIFCMDADISSWQMLESGIAKEVFFLTPKAYQ